MNCKSRFHLLASGLIVLILPCLLCAQPHSDNYILKKWAISSGGGS